MAPPPGRLPGPKRRPTLAALAASAAAHLLLLAGLARVPPPAARPLAEPVAVELIDVPRAAPPPEAGAGARPRAPPARRDAPLARAPEAAPGAALPPEPDGAPRARGGGPLDLVAEGLAVAPGVPDLRPRLVPGAPPSRGPTDAGPTGPQTTLDRWVADVAGRARVESGLVHPYCADLGKALARAWDPARILEGRGVAGYLVSAGENLRTFARVWQRIAEGYGRTGAPGLVDGGSERVRELAGLPPGPAQDALLEAEIDRQLRSAFSEGRVATVRVVQRPDGALSSVELTAPSRDAEVDREAVAAVRRAVASLPAPPPEALAGKDVLVTTWEFELEVSITPPVPAVSVELDEVLGVRDLRLPLDRRIWKKVRLVAVG